MMDSSAASDLSRADEQIALALLLDFLQASGAEEQGHSGATLRDHLLGTRVILRRWSAPQHVLDVGLFHSVYGSEAFKVQTVARSRRQEVRDLIGVEAEMLVYLFCSTSRLSLYANLYHGEPYALEAADDGSEVPITRDQLAALLLLDLANTLEQLPRLRMDPKELRKMHRLHEAATSWLPEVAVREMRGAFSGSSGAVEVHSCALEDLTDDRAVDPVAVHGAADTPPRPHAPA